MLRCSKNLVVPRRPSKTRGARKHEGRVPCILKGVGHCVEQCEVFYAGRSSKAHEEHVNLARSASVRMRNHG